MRTKSYHRENYATNTARIHIDASLDPCPLSLSVLSHVVQVWNHPVKVPHESVRRAADANVWPVPYQPLSVQVGHTAHSHSRLATEGRALPSIAFHCRAQYTYPERKYCSATTTAFLLLCMALFHHMTI